MKVQWQVTAMPAKQLLGLDASTELRDRLLAQLEGLSSGEDAAIWAHRSLPEKNRLTAADAARVEAAFQAGLATLPAGAADASQGQEAAPAGLSGVAGRPNVRRRSRAVDKTLLALPSHAAFGTGNTFALTWFAGRTQRMPTTCVSSRGALSAGRSAMSSPCLSAVGTIAKPTAGAMRLLGREAGIDTKVAARSLWLETHPLPAVQPTSGIKKAQTRELDPSWTMPIGRGPPIEARTRNEAICENRRY